MPVSVAKARVFCEHQLFNGSSFWFHISRDQRQFLSQIHLHSFQSAQRHDKCFGLCYYTIISKMVKVTTATAMEMRRGTTTCETKLFAKCETLHTSEKLLQETRTSKRHWLLKTNADPHSFSVP